MTTARKSALSEMRWLEDDYAALKEAHEKVSNWLFTLSRWVAERDYGHERIEIAMQAMRHEPAEVQASVFETSHPFGAVAEWYRGRMH